ncbi:MAG: VOC family protein [Gemmatimonadetes bacterium]|nr:VOC family protein [Gemmatimonadota bacterium]
MWRWTGCMVAVFVWLPGGLGAQDRSEGLLSFSMVGLTFVAIQTPDVAAAAAWYETVFGLPEVNRIDTPDGLYSIRILSREGLTVELIQTRGALSPSDRHLGLFKAGIYVDDIDAAHQWLIEHRVDSDDSVFIDEALQARSFVFRDLDGNRLQVFELCQGPCV